MYVEADDRMVVLIRSQVMGLVGQKSQTTVRKITCTVNMLEFMFGLGWHSQYENTKITD